MDALSPEMSIRALVHTGNEFTSSGKSHSCDRPTSDGPSPNAQTISVQDGRSETMRGEAINDRKREVVSGIKSGVPNTVPLQCRCASQRRGPPT